MTVTVTAEDIATGFPGDPVNCAVARAASRACGAPEIACQISKVTGSAYLLDVIETRSQYLLASYILPDEVDRFIVEYDNGGRVKPLTFELGGRAR